MFIKKSQLKTIISRNRRKIYRIFQHKHLQHQKNGKIITHATEVSEIFTVMHDFVQIIFENKK